MKTARTILEAALAALDDEDAPTTAETMAGRQPRGSGHNDPMRPTPKAGEGVKYPTDLARVIAERERYLAAQRKQEGGS